MNLKRFKKGGDENSDQLLKWIEEGCFDALKRKYLKSAVLTILADTTSPNNVLETYTLRVNYPDSPLHQTIDATTANIAQLSLTRNDKSVLAIESSPANFKEAISKILRSLCVMSQALKSLPAKKCLSMKLTYYDEVTPLGYEPPGFVAAEFDIDHLFQGSTCKYSFGKAGTPFHNLGLSMETICDDSVRPSKANTSSVNSQALVFPQSQVVAEEASNTINVQDGIDFNESVMIASQVAQAANSPPKFPVSQDNTTTKDTVPKIAAKVPINDLTDTQQQLQIIKCTCGYNVKDLEMLQCDSCANWQHSVCSGYVSCRDRRLEGHLYVCYYCQYGGQSNTFQFVQKLSQMRKALAIISAEGFENINTFSKRMGISNYCGAQFRDRLIKEKFMTRESTYKYAIAKKDDYIKERIKLYFNHHLEVHPEFIAAQAKDKASGKRVNTGGTAAVNNNTVNTTAVNAVSTNATTTTTNMPEFGKRKSPEKEIPLDIGNTVPFEVKEDQPITPSKPVESVFRTPPESDLKKKNKRKISIPSSRISCYNNI